MLYILLEHTVYNQNVGNDESQPLLKIEMYIIKIIAYSMQENIYKSLHVNVREASYEKIPLSMKT